MVVFLEDLYTTNIFQSVDRIFNFPLHSLEIVLTVYYPVCTWQNIRKNNPDKQEKKNNIIK